MLCLILSLFFYRFLLCFHLASTYIQPSEYEGILWSKNPHLQKKTTKTLLQLNLWPMSKWNIIKYNIYFKIPSLNAYILEKPFKGNVQLFYLKMYVWEKDILKFWSFVIYLNWTCCDYEILHYLSSVEGVVLWLRIWFIGMEVNHEYNHRWGGLEDKLKW